MSAAALKLPEPIAALEPSRISCRDTAAHALAVVRDGVITGEGPTTKGRVHFSRALDAVDAAWCARILTASAVDASAGQPGRSRSAVRDQRRRRRAQRRWTFRRSAGQGGRAPRGLRVRPAGAAAHRGTVAGNGDRKLGADPCGRRRYRSAGVDRQPDARQAALQPHPDGAGRHHRRRRDAAARRNCRTCSTSGCKFRRQKPACGRDGGGYFPAVFCLPVSASSPTVRPGNPAASK